MVIQNPVAHVKEGKSGRGRKTTGATVVVQATGNGNSLLSNEWCKKRKREHIFKKYLGCKNDRIWEEEKKRQR